MYFLGFMIMGGIYFSGSVQILATHNTPQPSLGIERDMYELHS